MQRQSRPISPKGTSLVWFFACVSQQLHLGISVTESRSSCQHTKEKVNSPSHLPSVDCVHFTATTRARRTRARAATTRRRRTPRRSAPTSSRSTATPPRWSAPADRSVGVVKSGIDQLLYVIVFSSFVLFLHRRVLRSEPCVIH